MKIALIGCGTWGQVILRDLVALKVETIVADPEESCRASALKQGAVQTVDHHSELGQVDGIIVATPATTHADLILDLDRSGSSVPIFCEKPLADNSSNAQRLLDRDGPPLYVMHIWRYHPGVRKLKELYDSGLIGEATQLHSIRTNWTSPRSDVDALANLAPHDLSIFQFLLGSLPEPVHATKEIINNEIVGCIAILKQSDGPDCIFEISNRHGEKRRELRIHGTKGVLVLPDDKQGHVQLVAGPGHILPDDIKTFPYEGPSALQTELQTFLNTLETGNNHDLCNAGDGAEILFCIDKIRALF